MSSTPWDRDAVVYCSYAALRYVHTHCPCENCNGKAVARSTELRHRKAAKLMSNCSTHARVEDTSGNNMEGIDDNDMEGTNDDNIEGINDDNMEGINDSGMEGINDNDMGLVGDTQSTFSESHPSNDLSSSAESQTNATVNPSTDLQRYFDCSFKDF